MSELGQTGQVMRAPNLEAEREIYVPRIKAFRQEVDALINRVKRKDYNEEATGKEIRPDAYSTHLAVEQVHIHLIEAKMWAGKILEGLGNPFPPELADKAK